MWTQAATLCIPASARRTPSRTASPAASLAPARWQKSPLRRTLPPCMAAIHGAWHARSAPWLWRLVRFPPRPLAPRIPRPAPRVPRVARVGRVHVRPRTSPGSGAAVQVPVLACGPICLPQIGSLLPARVCVHDHGLCGPVASRVPACCERVTACRVTPVADLRGVLLSASGPHETA